MSNKKLYNFSYNFSNNRNIVTQNLRYEQIPFKDENNDYDSDDSDIEIIIDSDNNDSNIEDDSDSEDDECII